MSYSNCSSRALSNPCLKVCDKNQNFNCVPAMTMVRDYAHSLTKGQEKLIEQLKLFFVKLALLSDAVIRGMNPKSLCSVDLEESCNVLGTLNEVQSQCRLQKHFANFAQGHEVIQKTCLAAFETRKVVGDLRMEIEQVFEQFQMEPLRHLRIHQVALRASQSSRELAITWQNCITASKKFLQTLQRGFWRAWLLRWNLGNPTSAARPLHQVRSLSKL